MRRIPVGPFKGQVMEIDFASQSQYYLGLWERETYRYIVPAFAGAEWLIDAGSQQGEYVISMLRKPHVRRVWAFDPDPASNAQLRRNLAANGLAGDPRLSISETFMGAEASENCVAIDDLDVDRTARGLIKIDVEGAELDVLKGGQSTLSSANAVVLVETHSAELEIDCMQLLTAVGYDVTVVHNAWWRRIVSESRTLPHNRWLWATRRRA